MHFFRAYGLPLLAGLPVVVVFGILSGFLIPLVNVLALRLLLFLLVCFGSLVVAAFLLHHLPDHTLDYDVEEGAEDVCKAKLK
jgi:hypothetical protein